MDLAAPNIEGVLETALYVEDMARAQRFYERTLGLSTMFRDDRLCALDCGPRSVLLLFARAKMSEGTQFPGGYIPPHEGAGRLHFAFAIGAEDLEAWEARLAAHGVAVEGRVSWPRGGRSVYFRDPDANLVELATPGLWANY
jgi:catechol 2,3-dioxygenase-like lactoylglutathione lyase family enzyme